MWFFLMCAASLETPRWTVRIGPTLARKCKTSEQKLRASIATMAERGMVDTDSSPGMVVMSTAERWNPMPRQRPSEAPEAVAGRVRKHREQARRADVTTDVTTPVTTDVTTQRNDVTLSRAESEQNRVRADARAGDDDDDQIKPWGSELPQPTRDRVLELINAIGPQYCDDETYASVVQLVGEYPWDAITAARAKVRQSDRPKPFPANIRKHLAPLPGTQSKKPVGPGDISNLFRAHAVGPADHSDD
ncbi:MAG: hypothetical protein ACSLE9_07835 [Burkholderiaceae bacterium]